MRVGAALVALAIAISISTSAHAQPGRTGPLPPPPVTPAPETRTKHYAGSILAVDALAAGMAVVGMGVLLAGFKNVDSSESDGGDGQIGLGFVLILASPLVYALVPPLVHVHHGNGRGAGKSFALRLGLPLAGVAIGALGDGAASAALAGLGAVVAMVTDWAVFAKVEVKGRPTPFAAPVTGGGATLGLMGTF